MLVIKGLALFLIVLLVLALLVWGVYSLWRFLHDRFTSDEARLRTELENTIEILQRQLKKEM